MNPIRTVARAVRRRTRSAVHGVRPLTLGVAARVLRAVRPGAATETRLLRWSWGSRNAERLDEYLVIGWQNPRINVQSILVRHALLRLLFGGAHEDLMSAEIRFAVELNEMLRIESERTQIPIKAYLDPDRQARIRELGLVISDREREFEERWRETLAAQAPAKLSVLEFACGSANDYRAFAAFGLAPFLDYVGIDLNPKNVANARRRFPEVRFEVGNAMATGEPDRSFDVVIASDLFEHLALDVAAGILAEARRVAKRAAIFSFFNMAEIAEHQVRPVAAYHWNLLSRARYEEALAKEFPSVAVTPIARWLERDFAYARTYNPRAYTMVAASGPWT